MKVKAAFASQCDPLWASIPLCVHLWVWIGVNRLVKASSSWRGSGRGPLHCLVVHKPKEQRLKLTWRPDSEGVLDSGLSQACSGRIGDEQ